MEQKGREKAMIQYAENRNRHGVDISSWTRQATKNVRRVHRMVPGYQETPLRPLNDLADRLGVRAVLVKDESGRFGLKAFKGLGGVYAMFRILCRELGLDENSATLDDLKTPEMQSRISGMTFATTTDGNHGKGVSWAAALFGCRSIVNMPKGTVEVRAEAIRQAGNAQVTITDMKYDDCVAWTAEQAEKNGWFLIQDTSWDGYEEIPFWIMQGYTTLIYEIAEKIEAAPTHLLLQAGVGSMAGAVAAAAREKWKDVRIYTVEPTEVACFYESFEKADSLPHMATGSGNTVMAGLNCALPCKLAWELLSGLAEGAFACEDEVTENGMRLLAGQNPPIVAGESGAVTTGILPEMAKQRRLTGLDPDSVILVINTEGDTDPEHWVQVVRG